MLPKTGSTPKLRENTIASFQQAVQRGASFLEFDVQVNAGALLANRRGPLCAWQTFIGTAQQVDCKQWLCCGV